MRVVAEPAPIPTSAQGSQAPAQGAAAMTASIDVSNPAVLQRFWRSVTSTLRKVNPARGVLFMNAKVFGETDGSGIVVQFGKDGGFAYNAAQKAEVQELLAKTIAQVAGGTVPYRLSIEGGAVSQAPAAQAGSSGSGRPARSLVPPAAVPAAKQPEPCKQVNAPTDVPVSANADRLSAKPVTAAAPVSSPSRHVAPDYDPVPYEEVPLDVYGAGVPGELDDAGSYDAAPSASLPAHPSSPQQTSSAPSFPLQASSIQPKSSGSPVQRAGSPVEPAPVPGPSTASQAAGGAGLHPGDLGALSEPRSAAVQEDSHLQGSEADQIKSILTNSFGPGVKFEELPE